MKGELKGRAQCQCGGILLEGVNKHAAVVGPWPRKQVGRNNTPPVCYRACTVPKCTSIMLVRLVFVNGWRFFFDHLERALPITQVIDLTIYCLKR